MDIVAAVVGGVVGTIVISIMMAMGPMMGMPKMAIWEMLGSMLDPEGNEAVGWVMHFLIGVVFALIYTALWATGIGSATVLSGALFGLVHWFVVGLMMGAMPMMHAGIKQGSVEAPGIYMLNNGILGFMGGLVGHVIFGVVVALIYGAMAG